MKRCVHICDWQYIYSEMTMQWYNIRHQPLFLLLRLGHWSCEKINYSCRVIHHHQFYMVAQVEGSRSTPPKGHNDQAWKSCFYVEEQQSRISNKWCFHYLHFNQVIFTNIAATWQRFCCSLNLVSLSLGQNYLAGGRYI